MLIRTTEREHNFTNRLFTHLSLFSLQGLTLTADLDFSAAVEAVQYNDGEEVNLSILFPELQAKAKYYLAKALDIPFYYIVYKEGTFYANLIRFEPDFSATLMLTMNEDQFIKWWASLKGMSQPKPLLITAATRVEKSVFDSVLTKHGMAWGGNIDGYMFKDKRFACIIENIYTQVHPLESPKGEPSPYFFKNGPNYNTWLPTIKLATQLNVPLFLFTIEGNSQRDRIGFTVIDHLSNRGIFYLDNIMPNENIVEGLDKIKETVLKSLSAPVPRII
ncbi:hypothetical protein [Hymenobacter sp. UYCo722]|uniref:hypothetical protein n=1 Tax=Hymenobacter sp. UYCo722 TaxID=3156335 RepID=UPI0033970199